MATERDTLAQLIASHVCGQFDSEMPSACGDAADAILSAGYVRVTSDATAAMADAIHAVDDKGCEFGIRGADCGDCVGRARAALRALRALRGESSNG